MGQYLPIIALMVLAILFGALSFVASGLLAPKRPSSAKEAPYECGIVPSRETPERFPVSFYIVAMLFIIFDIEIIFTYPYAVDHKYLGVPGFIEMISFSVVFFVAFVYMVARGALEWGPLKRSGSTDAPVIQQVMDTKPGARGVRVVGSEGRSGNEAA